MITLNKRLLQIKGRISYDSVSETSTGHYSEPPGVIMSIGYLRRLSNRNTFFTNIAYSCARNRTEPYLNDFSSLLISFGFSFNLTAGELLK